MIVDHLELLGMKTKDVVTGFKGVTTMISYDLYGCVQAGVTPKVDKDGSLPESKWYDINRLETIKSVISTCVSIAEVEDALNQLGKPAIDKATGFKGVITSILIYTNGMIDMAITPKVKSGKPVDGKWIIPCRVEIYGEPVIEQPDFTEGKFAETKHDPAEKPALNRH